MSQHSRRKGAQGELEACYFMQGLTNMAWERTAQRWGAATADIWTPDVPDLGLHVEVKRYGSLLKRPTSLATLHAMVTTPDRTIEFCLAERMRQTWETKVVPVVMGHHNLLEEFMAQAKTDARQTEIPLVLFRIDHCKWVAAWQSVHRRALHALMDGRWRDAA